MSIASTGGEMVSIGAFAVTNADVTLYNYNGLNQLVSVSENGLTSSYTYDGTGLRQSKTVNGTTTTHIWDGTNIVAEANGAYILKRYYRGANGLIFANLLGTETKYLKDGHGNITGLANMSGTTLNKAYCYDAFGVEKNIDKTDKNPFRYCGEYYDNEIDKIYLRARYYSSIQGRFITEDPIKDGLNWYAYCAGDPVNQIDPQGLASEFEGYTARELLEQINVERQKYKDQLENDPNNELELAKIHCRADFLRSALKATIEYNGGNDIHKEFKKAVDEAFENPNGQTDAQMTELIGMASGFTDTKAKKIDVSATNAARGITNTFVTKTLTETICFVEGTQICVKDGYKEIQEIQIGDMVYSKNEYTGEEGYKQVVNTFVNTVDVIVHIQTDTDIITSTEKHPFWVKDKGWTAASEVQCGDILVGKDNKNIKVISCKTEHLQNPVKVYNFEVEDWHTYFVANGIWVHNMCQIFDNKATATPTEILSVAEAWLGAGYYQYITKQDGLKSGIYVSRDGLRVFRMQKSDFDGNGIEANGRPHVHFQVYAQPFGTKENVQREQNIHVFIDE